MGSKCMLECRYLQRYGAAFRIYTHRVWILAAVQHPFGGIKAAMYFDSSIKKLTLDVDHNQTTSRSLRRTSHRSPNHHQQKRIISCVYTNIYKCNLRDCWCWSRMHSCPGCIVQLRGTALGQGWKILRCLVVANAHCHQTQKSQCKQQQISLLVTQQTGHLEQLVALEINSQQSTVNSQYIVAPFHYNTET